MIGQLSRELQIDFLSHNSIQHLLTWQLNISRLSFRRKPAGFRGTAVIQKKNGCRIKSGMTWLFYFVAGLILHALGFLALFRII
jgi:hypothetical protein